MQRKGRRRGFTIVELLMVLVTISILALVLIPTVFRTRSRVRDVQAEACLKELSSLQFVIAAAGGGYGNVDETHPDYPKACNSITVTEILVSDTTFEYEGSHVGSTVVYRVTPNNGVQRLP